MEKTNLILNSAIEIKDNNELEGKGKGRLFISKFIEPGVAHYEQFGDVLITKETLDKFIQSMVGCPVIIKHKDITDENVDKERVGVVSKVWYNEADGWYWCEGILWDKQAIDLVKNQGWSVSCTYDFESDKQEKTHNGKKIDMEFTGGEFLHLALVDNPRYERANIVVNSNGDTVENDKWITIKPNGEDAKGKHLLIKEGETVHEAMQRTFGIDGAKGQQKLFDTSKDRKTKEDFKREKEEKQKKADEIEKRKQEEKAKKELEKQENISKMKEDAKKLDYDEFFEKYKDKFEEYGYDKFFGGLDVWKEVHSDLDYFDIAAETYKDKKENAKKYTWGNKKYTADELMDKGFEPMKYSGSIYKDDHLTYLEKNDGKKLYRVAISEDEYKELKQKKDGKNKPIGFSDISSLLSDENKFKKFADDLYYNDANTPHKANISGELRQKLYHATHSNIPLTRSEWDERVKKQLKKINKANNSLLYRLDEILTDYKPVKEDLPILNGLKNILK